MSDVARLVAGKRLADPVHLATHVCELCQYGVHKRAVLVEVRQAGVTDSIQLLATLGFDRGVADLIEISQRRVNHAGAGRVKASRRFFERLDYFVPVSRALLEH